LARNIHYERADRGRAVACGGIGVTHLLAQRVGLPQDIDQHIHLLKRHLPYHESDHVLCLAYNILSGGTCIEDLELLRTNKAALDALGAQHIPDPTTAGDFCRRFENDSQVLLLMETLNEMRLKVGRQQEEKFFDQAVLDADGTIAPTTGQCKAGMDISYDGQWGYHPLLISLANSKEPLYLVNRPGNRPGHEQADGYLDKAITLCRRAEFQRILLRGDTDFTQTWKLDGWDQSGEVTLIFGADDIKPLERRAEALPATTWRRLQRPPKYQIKTQERKKPQNIKERIVRERQFKNLVLQWENVAEFDYRPTCCQRTYRRVALRKKTSVEKGQEKLFEQYRCFFYITNERELSAEERVFSANDRCDQENLIEPLKNGVRAMRNPLDHLHSPWAYRVMSSLAWALKAWCGLLLPVQAGPWEARNEEQKRSMVRMEFKGFLGAMMRLPCQIIRTGRRIVYRLLSWNPWTGCLLRLAEAMRRPLRC